MPPGSTQLAHRMRPNPSPGDGPFRLSTSLVIPCWRSKARSHTYAMHPIINNRQLSSSETKGQTEKTPLFCFSTPALHSSFQSYPIVPTLKTVEFGVCFISFSHQFSMYIPTRVRVLISRVSNFHLLFQWTTYCCQFLLWYCFCFFNFVCFHVM